MILSRASWVFALIRKPRASGDDPVYDGGDADCSR